MDIKDEITSRIRIEDVIGRIVSLRPSSRGYMGLCPFHGEKTPSFHVYTDTQTYYCFGCHEAGDIFTFTMKTQGMTFPEALEALASQAGIDTSKYRRGKNSDDGKRDIYGVMLLAHEYFRRNYETLPAGKAYMQKRGFSPEDASRYGVGYAPDSWDGLVSFLRGKNITDRQMIEAGLAVQGSRGIYDRFRGRVTFPVKDVAGRVIAFGGREIIPGKGAKYINSPESQIYRKRMNLYMLNEAGKYIRDRHYGILCEGYLDALRLHQKGFHESVASLGTSLTREQGQLIKRYADVCYICYDGDNAGKKAALRGMYILAEIGLDVYVVNLPDAKDPDDFLSVNPPEEFSRLLREARPLLREHIESLRPELEDRLTRKSALRDLWDGVMRLHPDDVMSYVPELCAVFNLPNEEMTRRILSRENNIATVPAMPTPEPEPVTMPDELECAFCALLMRYPQLRLHVAPGEVNDLLVSEMGRECAYAILMGNPDTLIDLWLSLGEVGKVGFIERGNIFVSGCKGLRGREIWQKVKSSLEKGRLQRRIDQIQRLIREGKAMPDDIDEFVRLCGQLKGLKV